MNRTIRREYIDRWIDEAYPDGITKLARKSRVPASSISKIRTGRIPKNRVDRRKLAKALGVTEDELFPVQGDEQAS